MPNTTSRMPRLFAELTVVFLGVYSAFFLDGCREERERELRRTQILQMLAEDFEAAAEQMGIATQSFDQGFGGFLRRYEQGERPTLNPVPLPVYDNIDTWGAVLSAGGLDSLEVEIIRDVEAVLAQVSPMTETAREYNAYVREVLVPNLDEPESEFYGEDGRLRPKYLWYWYSLRSVQEQMKSLTQGTQELAERLR